MKHLIITIIVILTWNTVFSQKNEIKISSWTIGAGVSNFAMHGDLTSDSPNLGYYLYLNKMITPAFGFELKGQILNTKGNSQNTYPTLPEYNANNLRFSGETFGGEANLVINLSALNTNKFIDRKFTVNSYFGLGYHTYSAKLYNDDTDELLADFVNNIRGNDSKSIYYTSGIGLKYRMSERLDLELRQNINFNNEDHLDAAVSKKQHLETFFTTQLGLVIKLHKKERENTKVEEVLLTEEIEIIEKSKTKLVDTDQDGVIDQFDKEQNTEKGAFVYSNGITIDSDKDGVPDHRDKCPLIKGDNKVGCKGEDKLETKPSDPTKVNEIIPIKTEVKKPVVEKKVTPIVEKVKKPIVKIIDSDNDGFPDDKDNCPQVYSKTNNGCPEVVIPVKTEVKKPAVKEKNTPIVETIKKPVTNKELSEYDKEKALIEAIIAQAKNKNKEVGSEDRTITLETTKERATSQKDVSQNRKVNPNIELIKEINKNNIKHNIYELDNSVNHLDIEISPIYPGCENQITNLDKENCMITKLSVFSLKNFNSSKFSHLKLGFGTKLMRIIFIVDENGKSKAYKAITNWQPEIVEEMKRIIKSLPTMKPGLLKNTPTPVKFSVEVPFKTNN